MTLMRVTASALVMVLSFALGHAPCCVIPSQCCEHAAAQADAETAPCCPKCRRKTHHPAPGPGPSSVCACPKIAGVLVLAPTLDVAPAALPELGCEIESARSFASVVVAPTEPRAPPGAGLALPLLL